MDNALEASSQRILNHLRRPIPGRGELLNENARNTVNEIVPIDPFIYGLCIDFLVRSPRLSMDCLNEKI